MKIQRNFFVGGYIVLHYGEYSFNNPTVRWFAANKKFDTKKEAWNYIKEQRKNHKKYNLDKEIKFVLREEIVKYYNDYKPF